VSSTPEERREARTAFRALPPSQRREALRLARSGGLHRDEVVREREVAWAHAWFDEFTFPRRVLMVVLLVSGCLISGLVFRPVIAVVAIFIEAWLGITMAMNWRAARGILRASGS